MWVAFFGGSAVHRYTSQGALDEVVEVGARQVTACTFGGPDLDRLYITSAAGDLDGVALAAAPLSGSLFVHEPGISGFLAHPFG